MYQQKLNTNTINELKQQGFSITSSESFKLGMTKFDKNEKFTIHVHAKIKWESEFILTDDVWKRSREISLFNKMITFVFLISSRCILYVVCADCYL